jgi:hypothetical protein
MAASSSKMLQIARTSGRKPDPKTKIQNGKNINPKTILDPFKIVEDGPFSSML